MPQLKKQDTLFSRQKTKTTIAIQTDADTSRVDSRGASRNKTIRKMDSTVKKKRIAQLSLKRVTRVEEPF